MIELSLRKDNQEIMRYALTKESTSLGRASQNDICLPDADISRVHLVIIRKGDQYIITDKSSNGTFVNGDRISSRELKPNDEIVLGPWSIVVNKGEEEERQTEIIELVPTKILSYRPDSNQLVYQKSVLEMVAPEKRSYPVIKSLISIGTAKSNDIVLAEDHVSAYHCRVENRKGTFYVKDLQSTNGTLLNGQRIVEAPLPFDSTIEIGKVKIKFKSDEEVEAVGTFKANEFEGIISSDPKMKSIFSVIDKLAKSDATILIQGETGTGKELIAKAMYKRSLREKKPYLAINCGAISKDLIESELFGHEKGAFTSALQQRKGLFEQAHGGTLFLDEIGELPLDLQPKLLRVLENGEIKRVGGSQLIDVDVRIIAATNRDLASEIKKGKFREDLFYRLFVIPISLPPLRQRKDDIPLLIQHFLKTVSAHSTKKFDDESMELLLNHPWPGNIRELKNVIGRALLQSNDSVIIPADIQFAPSSIKDVTAYEYDANAPAAPKVIKTLQDVEKEKIISELKKNKGNKTLTAKLLGIAKSTLHEKLKKYGIQDE